MSTILFFSLSSFLSGFFSKKNNAGPPSRYGGYFSVNTAPGLRVISLNMNYCMNKNIWLLLNSTDPAEELKWLVYELQLSEFKGSNSIFNPNDGCNKAIYVLLQIFG